MTLKRGYVKNLPRWVVLLIDIITVIMSYIASSYVINSFITDFDEKKLIYELPIIVSVYTLYYLYFGTYKGIVRQTGVKDAQSVFFANSLAFITLLGLNLVIRLILTTDLNDSFLINFRFSYSILFLHYFVITVTMIALRLFYKSLYDHFVEEHTRNTKVIVYGAGKAGVLTYNAIHNDPSSHSKILFFVDDDIKKAGKKINGINIFHSSILTPEFVKEKGIKEVIISIQNITNKELFKVSQNLDDLNVKVKTAPPVNAWLDGNYTFKQIKELNIEDLLGRESIKLDNPIINQELKGKNILITGAAGSIGSEIARQVARKDFNKLILVDIAESALYDVQQSIKSDNYENIEFIVGNIRDEDRMRTVFETHQPNYIYHAAAYKHVPLMEKYPFEAVNTNVKGTKIIADLANEFNVEKFVMVSTDKAVNPTNIMGATKRCAEIYVNCLNDLSKTNYIITRFGNVLGSNGSVIPLFKRQMQNGGPLTVTHPEITRFFMTIPEACQLVLEAGTMGHGGEIFVFDMGESMKIFDLAKRMIKLSGYKYPEEMDIKIVGLRPGEKIFEELLANDENTLKTHHEKIMIATVNKDRTVDRHLYINELVDFSTDNQFGLSNNVILVKKIKAIVPEFISQNSEYQKLDALV